MNFALFILGMGFVSANCDDDFMEIEREPYFIDKSMLIQDFINSKLKARVILAPARFGKTTNLRMLESFFQLPRDKDGNEIDAERAKTFETFKKLKIGNTPDFKVNFGKYNVLYFNFVGLKAFVSYRSFLIQFRAVIYEIFSKWDWLTRKSKIDDRDKFWWSFCSNPPQDHTIENLKNCGSELILLLKKHTKKPCIVLIDEFDTPLHFILTTNHEDLNNANEIRKIGDFLAWFVTSLVKNNDLHKVLLTGIMRMRATVDHLDGGLDIKSIFEDKDLLKHYGFHNADINSLGKKYSLNPTIRLRMKEYFGGYRAYFDGNIEVYNPSSVVSYLLDGMPEDVEDVRMIGSYAPIPHLQPFKRILQPAIMGGKVLESLTTDGIAEGEFREVITSEMVTDFKMFAFKRLPTTPSRESLFLQYLLETGFYTHKKVIKSGTTNLVVPNWTIKQHIQGEVLKKEYFKKLWHHTEADIRNFVDEIEDLEDSSESLKRLTKALAVIFNRVENPRSELEMVAPVFSYISSGLEEVICELFIESKRSLVSNDNLFIRRADDSDIIMVFKSGTKDVGNFGDVRSNRGAPSKVDVVMKEAMSRDFSLQLYKMYPKRNLILVAVYLNKTHCGSSLCFNGEDIITSKFETRGPAVFTVTTPKSDELENRPIGDHQIIDLNL